MRAHAGSAPRPPPNWPGRARAWPWSAWSPSAWLPWPSGPADGGARPTSGTGPPSGGPRDHFSAQPEWLRIPEDSQNDQHRERGGETQHRVFGDLGDRHLDVAGNPGRGELDDNQEIHFPGVMRALLEVGYTGYVAQEFIPTRDAYTSLSQSIDICDV